MLALAALALLLPAACAHSPGSPQHRAAATDPSDPLEPMNRAVFDFNMGLDDAVIRPVAVGYRHAVHPWVRQRIHNVVHNAHEPRHAINALLQGEPLVAGSNLMRFVINTTLGLGGMFDLAPIGGPPRQPRDFGQTLYRWGVPDGPFLMVPVLGPSNPRDLTGRVADGFINPVTWLMPLGGNIARGAVEGIDLRERNIETLDNLRAESLDFYARIRSIWQQQRNAELGRTSAEPEGLDVLEDPEAPAPAPGAAVAPPSPQRLATPGLAAPGPVTRDPTTPARRRPAVAPRPMPRNSLAGVRSAPRRAATAAAGRAEAPRRLAAAAAPR